MKASAEASRDGFPLVVYTDGQPPDLSMLEGPVRFAGVEDLPSAVVGAEALLVWDFETTGAVARAVSRYGRSLRWVHVNSVGVEHVLSGALSGRDLVVTNAGGVMDDAVAEFALALILAMAKKIPTVVNNQGRHEWRHQVTETIIGRKALVVGAGAIGSAVGRLLAGVGMTPDAVASVSRSSQGTAFGTIYGAADLLELVGGYDYVILTLPLTPQTLQMVDATFLSRMRRTARLVNLGRGQLVDEGALVSALERGDIAGAALDVFREEPLPTDHPLWSMDRVVISPHMAGDYAGWQSVQRDLFLENYRRYAEGCRLLNGVDLATGYVPATAERYQRPLQNTRATPRASP
jgi:phosphoglycerate dehydrogenase-like enzyme